MKHLNAICCQLLPLADILCPFSARTSSCQTFDSLDLARYSDDGDRQDDKVAGKAVKDQHIHYVIYNTEQRVHIFIFILLVAVLEFELRKAHDTIKSLRASLTKTAGENTYISA